MQFPFSSNVDRRHFSAESGGVSLVSKNIHFQLNINIAGIIVGKFWYCWNWYHWKFGWVYMGIAKLFGIIKRLGTIWCWFEVWLSENIGRKGLIECCWNVGNC